MKHRRAQIIDALAELFEPLTEPSIIVTKAQMLSGAEDKTIVDDLSACPDELTLRVEIDKTAELDGPDSKGTIEITYEGSDHSTDTITLRFASGSLMAAQTAKLPTKAKITQVETTGWSAGTFSITASEFPLQIKTLQKRYRHWTTLDQQGAIPAILLNFDEVLRKRDGGANTEFAALGETEEYLPIALDVVLKESAEFPKPLTDQVSDAMYTVERIVNGTPDLGIEGVYRTRVIEVHTSAGRISALEGTPFEVVRHRIVVTHIYPSNTSV